MKNEPLISILMPVFNEEKYICEAVESVLNQSYKNFELIIINDGSTDCTENRIKMSFSDNRIILLSPGKIGKNAAFNYGYMKASGEWVVFFAGDDVLPANSLEIRIDRLRHFDPQKDMAVAAGKIKTVSTMRRFNNTIIPKGDKGNFSGGCIILSRKITQLIFPLPENLPNEDQWTGLVIKYFAKKIVDIPKIVLHYRIHEKNSNSFLEPFAVRNISIHKRNLVYKNFQQRFCENLDDKQHNELIELDKAEQLRFKGQVWQLLLSPIKLSAKIRFVSYSNKYLYYLRTRLYKIISGWGHS